MPLRCWLDKLEGALHTANFFSGLQHQSTLKNFEFCQGLLVQFKPCYHHLCFVVSKGIMREVFVQFILWSALEKIQRNTSNDSGMFGTLFQSYFQNTQYSRAQLAYSNYTLISMSVLIELINFVQVVYTTSHKDIFQLTMKLLYGHVKQIRLYNVLVLSVAKL